MVNAQKLRLEWFRKDYYQLSIVGLILSDGDSDELFVRQIRPSLFFLVLLRYRDLKITDARSVE